MRSNYAQETKLHCRTKQGANGKTIIESMFFTPPLKLIEPIYDGDIANLMVLNVSAGLMEGDKQDIVFDISSNSKLRVTSQSYEKIHNTQDGYAMRETTINIADNAFFSYMPLPCIPFANSTFKNSTTIHLKKDSVLHYGEIFCAGRVARDEIFAFKNFHQNIYVYKHNELLFYDNMNLCPDSMDLRNMCAFDNYTHYLCFIAYDKHMDIAYLQEQIDKSKLNAAISTNNDMIIVKALANESEPLIDLQSELTKIS